MQICCETGKKTLFRPPSAKARYCSWECAQRRTRRRTDPLERFWKKVRTGDGCWEWIGQTNNEGYGRFYDPDTNRKELAHRWIWKRLCGPLAADEFLCHSCDNPSCVRLEHLSIDDNSGNMQDSLRKGRWQSERRRRRQVRGERVNTAKLKPAEVEEARRLRAEGALLRVLADRYGVSISCISRAVRGDTWKDT